MKRKIISFIFMSLLLLSAAIADKKELNLPIDSKPVDRITVPTPTSFAPMLKNAKESVVAVYTRKVVKVVRGANPMSPQQQFLHRFFGLPSPRQQVPQENNSDEQRIPQGIGSGVIITNDGYIVTNNHVVTDKRGQDADEILVKLNDARELPAVIVGRDPRTDVAVLKVDADDLSAIDIADSDNIEVGDIVFAIGNPMGVGITVTQGIVSATGRAIGIYGNDGYENFIQTDASINPGNSGGALVDTEGRLIGVNSAILSRTGSNIGIGFAIPSNLTVSIIKHLTQFGEVKRGLLGIQISDLTPDVAEAFDVDVTEGVVVDKVEEGFAADEAGIERGDIIVAIDDKPVRNANELRLRIGQTPPGTRLKITLYRKGKQRAIEATVRDQNLFAATNQIFEGIMVVPINDEIRKQFGYPQNLRGLAITEIDVNSPYARYLRPGMAVLEINDKNIAEASDARDAIVKGVNKLYIYDRGRLGYLALRVR